MGGLIDFQGFVMGQHRVLGTVEERLCEIQSHYETFFAQVGRIREEELDQLETLVQQRRGELPAWLDGALERRRPEVEAELDARLQALRIERDEQRETAENLRKRSLELEAEIHGRNEALDAQEEALKTRNEELLARIGRYNGKIREMSGGFGFFANVLGMRRLRRERLELDREQADVAAHIEALRSRWRDAEAEHVEAEGVRREAWRDARNLAAQAQTRLQWLTDSRERILYRTTLERAMADNPATLPTAHCGALPCPSCGYGNPDEGVLCQVCGARLGEDRQDLEGSLLEIAAAVRIHDTFSEGMAASQQIIGLVRGLRSGHETFAQSVQDMIDSQSRHKLDTLELDVPERSVAYSDVFTELRDGLSTEGHRHPLDLAKEVEELLAGRLSEEAIQDYFEGMGGALSQAADAQW